MTNIKLLVLREQMKWTQEKVAEKADCHRLTYQRVEDKGDVPGLKTAIGIAKVFNIKTIAEMEEIFLHKNVQDRTMEELDK